MLNIPSNVKQKLQSDICRKELRITVGSVVCNNTDIYADSFKLTETIMDGKVEFVGCISSVMEAKISVTKLPKANYHGENVVAEVAVHLDNAGTLSDYIPLFIGVVDTCEKSADGNWQTITCFDALAYLTDTPAYNEYKAAFNGGSVTLEDFRGTIAAAFGLTEEDQHLPNDVVEFKKRYRNKDLTALALLRHITQINGAFGIINRDGNFEYRFIDDSASPEDVSFYRSLEYSDQVITPINKGLNIRTNSNDAGVTVTWLDYQDYAGQEPVGGWSDDSTDDYLVDEDDIDITDGNYVVESNLIAYKLAAKKKRILAANIMAQVGHDAVFRNYKVVCNGLPYVECGDKVRFTKADGTQIGFVVFKRTLQGVQVMTDTYECAPEPETVKTSSGTSSTNSSYVSNVANSTTSMSGSPTDALGLTEKSITANGTYAATEDGAEGYSQVTVNVPSGGGGGVGLRYPWTRLSDLPFSFTRGSCITYHGKIHCFGSTHNHTDTDIQKHYVYDGTSWTQLNPLPIGAHQYADHAWVTIYNYHAFVAHDKLYISIDEFTPVIYEWIEDYDTWSDHDGTIPDEYVYLHTNNGCHFAEFNGGRLHILCGNNAQLNEVQVLDFGTITPYYIASDGSLVTFYDSEHPGETGCVPWPCGNGTNVVVNDVCHVFGGGDGYEPEEEIFYDEVLRFNDYFDGVTPSWRYHASSSDGFHWTRRSAPPINIAFPQFGSSQYYLQNQQTPPKGIVINGLVHFIVGSHHLVYDPTADAWGLTDNFCLPNDITHVQDPANVMLDATYSGIAELNGEIHVIGGSGNFLTQHWKCSPLLTT